MKIVLDGNSATSWKIKLKKRNNVMQLSFIGHNKYEMHHLNSKTLQKHVKKTIEQLKMCKVKKDVSSLYVYNANEFKRESISITNYVKYGNLIERRHQRETREKSRNHKQNTSQGNIQFSFM